MESDAPSVPAGREVALARALAAAHDTLAAKLALLEIEREAGTMTAAQVAEQAAAAQVDYDRARALAKIQAETDRLSSARDADTPAADRPSPSR